MKCPHCQANMIRESRDGDPMIANRGLILKDDHIVMICPKCGGNVALGQTLTKAVQQTAILFFRRQPK